MKIALRAKPNVKLQARRADLARDAIRRIDGARVIRWTLSIAGVSLLAWATIHKVLPASFPWQPIATIVAAWIAVQSAVENYTKQKYWEKRFEAYQKTIDSLSLLRQYHSLKTKSEVYEMEHRDPSPWLKERMDALEAPTDAARDHLDILANTAPFLLSREAIEAIKTMNSDFKQITTQQDFFDYLDEYDRAYKKCLDELNRCAVKDLGIKGR